MSYAEADMGLPSGMTIGDHFLIRRKLGGGGMGEVYLAENLNVPDKKYAIKVLRQEFSGNAGFVEMLRDEAMKQSRLEHDNVGGMYDFFAWQGSYCLVQNFVDGKTLQDLLAEHPNGLLLAQALPMMMGILAGLDYAHAMGILHCDIKASNVIVAPDGRPRVIDFGIAQSIGPVAHTSRAIGAYTAEYVSPEQVLSPHAIDHRADVFSAGVLFFEMLAGRLPFDFPTVSKIVMAHVKIPAPRFAKVNIADVPPAVEAVVQCLLSKFPSERQPTARDLARHFGQAVGLDVWNDAAPVGYSHASPSQQTMAMTVVEKTMVDVPAPSAEVDRFTFYDKFEAMLPPKIAATKLKGFIEEVDGTVIDSEPGHIQLGVGLPEGGAAKSTRSGILGWLSSIRGDRGIRPGEEPIEVHLQLQNLDANRVAVNVTFRPYPEYLPDDPETWQARCEEIYNVLRMFLMAR